MKLLTVPDPILYQIADVVTTFDSKLMEDVAGMRKVLLDAHDPEGVGLAGNQVGLLKRIFLMRLTPTSSIEVCINPQLSHRKTNPPRTSKASDDEPLEGCLSVPRIWAPVIRDWEVTMDWQDEEGKPKRDVFTGFASAVIQHEIDHLDGILFTKRAMEQGAIIYEERRKKLYPVEI